MGYDWESKENVELTDVHLWEMWEMNMSHLIVYYILVL